MNCYLCTGEILSTEERVHVYVCVILPKHTNADKAHVILCLACAQGSLPMGRVLGECEKDHVFPHEGGVRV